MSAAAGQVDAAGRRLEVHDLAGGEPALVLLHEGLGSAGLWRGFPLALHEATGRRVVAYSRAGHGRSGPEPGHRTAAFFDAEADDVLPALLRGLGIERPLIVGHSDGASIALLHAARHPVAGAVLMAPHVVVEDMTIAGIERTREDFAGGDLRERLARHHDDADATFGAWCGLWLHPAFRSWSIETAADDVTAPLLLVQGADDEYATLDQLDRIEARARGRVGRLVVPGGHHPHVEQEEQVVAAIAAFAASVPATPCRGGPGTPPTRTA